MRLSEKDERFNRFRVAANVLLGCWVMTLVVFLSIITRTSLSFYLNGSITDIVITEELSFFMIVATYLQFGMVFIMVLLLLINNATGHLDEVVLPVRYNDKRAIVIFIFYWSLFLIPWYAPVLRFIIPGILSVLVVAYVLARMLIMKLRERKKSYQEEQDEIWEISEGLGNLHGREWFKFKGDVINRIIIRLLRNQIRGYEVVGPSVFIDRIPLEFDIIIVSEGAKPKEDTNAFEARDVKLIIETKKHGFYYKKLEAADRIREYFGAFENTTKPFLYITVKESKTMMDATSSVLGDRAFFLGLSGGSQRSGEWEKFVKKTLELLEIEAAERM